MGFFTRTAMDALMKTSHPEINRRQCWNLHPHRKPCTTCKDICPYGEEIFTRPNLVKDWDPAPTADCAFPPAAAAALRLRRSRCSGIPPRRTPTTIPSGSAVRSPAARTPWCAAASVPSRGSAGVSGTEQKDRAGPDPLRAVRERPLRRAAAQGADPPCGLFRSADVRSAVLAGV